MEIPANYTISCFDNYFPYMDLADKVASQYKEDANFEQINVFKLILNINYLRYIDRSNRFFRIYFDNLPNYMEYFPFWPEEEKYIIKKLMADPSMSTDLMLHNNTVLDYMIEDVKRMIKRKDKNLVETIFTDRKINEAINLINSRGYILTLKGWKAIHKKTEEIEPEDINNLGYILLPSADAINHESLPTEHVDVSRSNFSFQTGFVAVKAGRKFKKGDEFKINYDRFIGVHSIFKRYGFVPIESINHNQVFLNEYYDLGNSTYTVKKLCMALQACKGSSPSNNVFAVSKVTNNIDMSKINLNRIQYWIGDPINEYKVIDIYNSIVNMKHSNITEGIALSKFIYDFYGLLIYSTNFRVDIENLLKMYDMNEKGIDLREIFKITNIKITLNEHPVTIHQRFRELLKYALLNQHMVAVNLKHALIMLDKTLENIWLETKIDILDTLNSEEHI